MTVIKHCAVVFLSVLVLAGCEADKDKIAREKVEAIKQVIATRTLEYADISSSQPLRSDNVNRCIVQMSENKAKLDAIQVDYAETQTVQSSDTHTLYSLINYQLTACKDARQTQGY
ncbi:MAG TPA: hypothetical protein DIT33_02650 [Pseudomonas sp.]|uniref:hypothetical protein n=1 Tax=Pseudomonas sp. TaxID=306 RepID=UPI000ED6CF68|nr:hypothetical protein [Pseudomonas sp.]HCN62280.1 hypothetical protein [Pseudomonas sp.]